MNTQEMTPRELDARVAERVMKLSYILFDGTDKDADELIPAYSTDISAAWLVVEKMEKHGYYFAIYNLKMPKYGFVVLAIGMENLRVEHPPLPKPSAAPR